MPPSSTERYTTRTGYLLSAGESCLIQLGGAILEIIMPPILPLNELLTIDMPQTLRNFELVRNYLLETCHAEIWDFITDIRRRNPEQHWNRWMVAKGEGPIVGRWPLRFSKVVKAEASHIGLTPKILADIGERLTAGNLTKTVYMEIVDDIKWKMGAFGDGYSCWFDSEHVSYRFRKHLFKIGRGRALKFFPNEAAYAADPLKGCGRCWMVVDGEHCYLWNGRGAGITTLAAAEALATVLKCEYQDDNFTIKGSYLDSLGYIVGPAPLPPRNKVLDFDLPKDCIFPGY